MRPVLSARHAILAPTLRLNARPFRIVRRLALKEDADRHPEHLEAKKQEQLHKAKSGKGEWHEELASASESHVKADKEQVKDHDEHIEALQKHTEKKAQSGKV